MGLQPCQPSCRSEIRFIKQGDFGNEKILDIVQNDNEKVVSGILIKKSKPTDITK
jgi:hypothetical protein